jgi:hypothetical protein
MAQRLAAGGDTRTSSHDAMAQFREAVANGGVAKALEFLNARTAYRYTAIFRFEGDVMRNIWLYDRLGEDGATFASVPLGDSFCQYVMAENGFSTPDSGSDERLASHAYRGILNSYVGLPLCREAGSIYGTFCHFDFNQQTLPDNEIPFLESVTPELMKHLE